MVRPKRRAGHGAWWGVVFLFLFAALSAGCSCDDASNSGAGASAGAGGNGGGGATTMVPSDLKAVIIATPPAIPRGDGFATQVRLDGSASTSSGGALKYQWDIGNGKLVSGELVGAQIFASFAGLDNEPVTLTVTDGEVSNSTVTVIRVQSPPVAIVTDEITTDTSVPVTIDAALSFDRDGDPLSFAWSIIDGPAGAQVTGMDGGKATFSSPIPGDHIVELALTAGGQTVFGQTIVHVFPTAAEQVPIGVTVVANPPVAAKGSNVSFQISLSDTPKGPFTVTLRAGAQVIPVNNLAANAVFDVPGDYPLIADVVAVGRAGRGRAPLQVFDPAQPDNGPPVVALSTPEEAARLTASTQATGTASDSDLAAYYLEARQAAALPSEPWQLLAKGTSSVNGGNLGEIDVVLLRQAEYLLRLRAVDRRGNVATAERKMTVDYTNPRGNLRFVLTDFQAAFSGPPIVIRRGYDSFDRNVGDFGYGWTLSSSGNGSVTRENPIGQGWDATGTNCIFSFNLTEQVNHLITVSIGDQRSFYAPTPEITSCITGAVIVTNKFTKLGTGKGSMTIEHQGEDLMIPFGNNNMYRFDDLFETTKIYDPDDYTVTNPDLSTAKFSNGGAGGNPKLVQMRDVNGNGFDVSADEKKITHTSGATIELERNAAGRVTALKRPDGKSRTYAYNAAQQLVRVSDFDGRTTRYFYGPDNVLSRIVGPRGNVLFDARYDDNARLIEVQDGAADTNATTTYDTEANKEVTKLPDGVIEISTYDQSGNTKLRTMNGMEVEKFDADPQAKVNSFTDARGKSTVLAYDDVNGPVSINPEGVGKVDFQWDAEGHLTGMTTPKGNITYERDATGRMTRFQGGGEDITIERNQTGKISKVNMNGDVMSFTHDAAGYVKSVTNEGKTFNYDVNGVGDITGVHYMAEGQQHDITMKVDADGIPTEMTAMIDGQMITQQSATQDEEGSISTDGSGRKLIFDGRGRPKHLIANGGTVSSREYDPTGKLSAYTMPEGGRTERVFDPTSGAAVTTLPNGQKTIVMTDDKGQTVSRETPGNQITTYAYDAKGHLTKTVLADGRIATEEYDAKDHVTKRVHPDGSVELLTYDANGNMATRSLRGRPPFAYSYDENKLVKVVSGIGVTQNRTYHPDNSLAGISYTGGPPAVAYTYKARKLSAITDPAGHTRTFTRRKFGSEQVETRPSGSTMTTTMLPDHSVQGFDFDGRGVLVTLDANNRITSQTAEDGTKAEMVYDRDGHLKSYTDTFGTTSFARDTLGRVLLMSLADGRSLKLTYHEHFGVAKLQTPAATDTLEYNPVGRVTRVGLDETDGIEVGYDAGGRQSTYTLGALEVAATFDEGGLLKKVTTKQGGQVLLSDEVTYDNDGRPVTITSEGGQARNFAYDAAERLTKDTDVAYAYDAASNLVGIGGKTLTYDVDDHLLGDGENTFTSDKSGHLLSIDGPDSADLTWDGLGRLVKVVKGGQTVTYGYDGQGLLVSRDDGTSTRRFFWTAHESVPALLEEYDGQTGAVLAHNTHLGRVTVRTTPEHRYTFVRDSLSNARLVVDETGKVVDVREFTAYGKLRSGSTTLELPFGFAGEWTDPVTGFVFLRARWYAPEIARFLSEDPDEPRLEVPITLNRFQYGNGMPTVFVDPLGTQDLIGLISTMAGYGNLNSMSTLTNANYYLSLTSQFAGLAVGLYALDRSQLFKFIQRKGSWAPTSVMFGLSGSAWGGGVGVTLGIELQLHFNTKNFNGHLTPYIFWGGPGTGTAALAKAKEDGADPSTIILPPLGGGIIGTQAFIGAGYSFYTGLSWDNVHPDAGSGPNASISAPPALLFPFVTLSALIQMDGAGQLAAAGAFAGAVANGVAALAKLGPSFTALLTATFNAAMAANANPGQIWIKQPPPSTAAVNNAASNFRSSLSKWTEVDSVSFGWSPYPSDSKLCQKDVANDKWINCEKTQAWSLGFDKASWFGAKLFGQKKTNTINPATQAPQLFSYSFSMYWCLFNGAPGQACDQEVDFNDNKGFW